MDKMVHVSTFCVSNSYGSILQALGLKLALRELGYGSCVEQLASAPLDKPEISFRSKTLKGKLMALLRCLVYPKLCRKQRGTKSFIEEHIDAAYYSDMEEMRQAMKEESLFLAGSDQIWNPRINAPQFFLEFAPPNARRLSYAASMGTVKIPKEREALFAEQLRKMDWISVREADNAEILLHYTDKRIDVNIDPTFLCPVDQWRSYQKEYPIKEPYILVYPLYWNKQYNTYLKELHQRTKKKIVVIADHRRNIYANKWLYDVDVGQFLWLIDHADAVVSSSFHGVAMAINFNKPILPIVNPRAPSRIDNLLQLLSYPDVTFDMISVGEKMDYNTVNKRIAEERRKGVMFLKEMLESET